MLGGHGVRFATGRVALVLSLLAGICALRLADADEPGEQLAQQVYDRNDGRDATASVVMTLTERDRDPRIRRMLSYRLDMKRGERATLVRFTDPADIAGTGLLTLDRASGESDQWIYLPAMDRVRRIAANRQGGRFVNSDYYFEDLRDRKVSKDAHRLLGRERIAGVLCDILESVPVEPGNSVYKKRLSWIDPLTLLPMRIDYYEKREEQPSKRWLLLKREKKQGYWTVMDSTMTDLDSGHQTRLTVEHIVYDRGLPLTLFTPRVLQDESLEEEYRP